MILFQVNLWCCLSWWIIWKNPIMKLIEVITISQFHDPSISPCYQFLMYSFNTSSSSSLSISITSPPVTLVGTDKKFSPELFVTNTVRCSSLILGSSCMILLIPYSSSISVNRIEVRDCLITFPIFVPSQRLIVRNVRELFSSNRGVSHLH